MSLWDALRMNMMISYQELVRTFLQQTCDESELNVYRSAVGEIMGRMLIDIMNPIYKQHPELKPKELN